MINEEGLRDWFGKSKSKDGKKGWVNVVTGDSASDKPGEGVPKCVSSKRSFYVEEREKAATAQRRREEKIQDNNRSLERLQTTMVKTDRKVRKEDMESTEEPRTRRVRVQVLRTPVTTRSSPVTLYTSVIYAFHSIGQVS